MSAFCISKDAYKIGNFAIKKEAYESRKIQGVALPEKERSWQIRKGSDNGENNGKQYDGAIQL